MEEELVKKTTEEKIDNEKTNETREKIVRKPEWHDKNGKFAKGNQFSKLNIGKKHITTLVFNELKKKILDSQGKSTDKTYMDMFLKAVILKITKDGDTQMMKHFWEMIDGKAKQEVDMEVSEKPTPIIYVPNNDSIQENSETE